MKWGAVFGVCAALVFAGTANAEKVPSRTRANVAQAAVQLSFNGPWDYFTKVSGRRSRCPRDHGVFRCPVLMKWRKLHTQGPWESCRVPILAWKHGWRVDVRAKHRRCDLPTTDGS